MVAKNDPAQKPVETTNQPPICGLILPISAMPPTYDSQHWADVRAVLDEAVRDAGMHPQIVSDSFESDVITQRIIANIFNNPVVVCDVSGLNPNVMFELGLRLASKKATIIVTDSIGDIPFDTRIIEHVKYSRGLRIHETRDFISDLSGRIKEAHGRVVNGSYTPFLDNFTGVEAQDAKISDVSQIAYLSTQIEAIHRELVRSSRSARVTSLLNKYSDPQPSGEITTNTIIYRIVTEGADIDAIRAGLALTTGVIEYDVIPRGEETEIRVTHFPSARATIFDLVDRVIIANSTGGTRPS